MSISALAGVGRPSNSALCVVSILNFARRNTENAATVTVGADGQGATESDANPKISGNMAMMSGGGLYVRGTNANVTINSGMIAQNKVSAYVKNQDVANEMGGVTLNAGLVTHVVVTFNGNQGEIDNA